MPIVSVSPERCTWYVELKSNNWTREKINFVFVQAKYQWNESYGLSVVRTLTWIIIKINKWMKIKQERRDKKWAMRVHWERVGWVRRVRE